VFFYYGESRNIIDGGWLKTESRNDSEISGGIEFVSVIGAYNTFVLDESSGECRSLMRTNIFKCVIGVVRGFPDNIVFSPYRYLVWAILSNTVFFGDDEPRETELFFDDWYDILDTFVHPFTSRMSRLNESVC
jgi:hypothetical protein